MIAFHRHLLAVLRRPRVPATSTIPDPRPWLPADRARILAGASRPQLAPASSTDAGHSCGGKCLGTSAPGAASAPGGGPGVTQDTLPAPSMLVAGGGESPTSGIFAFPGLPAPKSSGLLEIQVDVGDPNAKVDLSKGLELELNLDGAIGATPEEKKNAATLVWVIVVIWLVLLLTSGKGSRKTW